MTAPGPFAWVAALVLSVGLAGGVYAHALEPGYLEISGQGGDTFRVVWRVPDVGGRAMPIVAQLPDACDQTTPPPLRAANGGWSSAWSTSCAGGLAGGTVTIKGLERTSTDVLVRWQEAPDAANHALRLTSRAPSLVLPARSSSAATFLAFGRLGFEHILSGIDHLLFVLALMIVTPDLRRLAGAITSFTIAHSLTLAAASLGWVHVPGAPVEALIVLSVMVLAAEAVKEESGAPGLTARWPWLVCFPFGLLHGLGFAGALRDIGLPQGDVPLALFAFNLGVEAGQLAFVMAVLALLALGRAVGVPRFLFNWRGPAWAIGGIAGIWFVERVAAF